MDRKWLDSLLSELYREEMKLLGFRKKGRTFSRERPTYFERFNFQGSTTSDFANDYGRFFINVGIEFRDLPPLRYWSLFPHTHWACRVEQLVPDAPSQLEYGQATDRVSLKREIFSLLAASSKALSARAEELRKECLTST